MQSAYDKKSFGKVNALLELQSPPLPFGDGSQSAGGEECARFFGGR